MVLFVCADPENGVAFNSRRQTSDTAVYADLCAFAESNRCGITMTEYSRKAVARYLTKFQPLGLQHPIFTEEPQGFFSELQDCGDFMSIEEYSEVVLYRWDHVYPADTYLQLDLHSLCKIDEQVLSGSSHEKITKETYRKG
ncbi:MAG: hypothetical protein K6F80_07660 [Oscillospiraceae bacterium]|nr:hypothetical protein [Oscillospiraceae bacterium]